jgi:hypothetical protein
MSLKSCRQAKIDTENLMRSNSKLVSFSGHPIKARGKVRTTVRHKDKYFLLEIQIVSKDVQPVLGLKSSIDLNLVNRVHTVNEKKNQSSASAVPKDCSKSMIIYSMALDACQVNTILKLTTAYHP